MDPVAGRETSRLQHDRRVVGGLGGDRGDFHRLPDDALHDLGGGDLAQRLGEKADAVAKDRDPVGDLEHFLRGRCR